MHRYSDTDFLKLQRIYMDDQGSFENMISFMSFYEFLENTN